MLHIPVNERVPGEHVGGVMFHSFLLQQILPVINQYSISKADLLYHAEIPEGYLIIIKALMECHKMHEEEDRYHRNNTDVANAFMTKKHIPLKHQDYMKESHFLNVYQYV